ncbi:T9SS type B sorting domain-containing protein [Chryseobacterium sp.]|uniref:DUF7948 domain-containing protein n=1 Tax=Chryseobacterium sp. TaxID=1871047 RepID=UPI0011C920BE|nr:T9SS type B sorting domain-containing protein [Chryseobacterium sp.]TXF77688.1 T9SS type B sorting domain-containing protein [Chryseobacterium sp.]
MKKITLCLIFTLTHIIMFSQEKLTPQNDYLFYENKGQIVDQDGKQNAEVKYLYHSAGLNVQLRKNGFSYDLYEVKKIQNPKNKTVPETNIPEGKIYHFDDFLYEKMLHRVDIELMGSNTDPVIIPEGKTAEYDNYYNLESTQKGVTNVHRFKSLLYKNIYPKIDLKFFKPKDSLKPIEYNFIIHPGGKISDIKMKINGARAQIANGKLTMKVRFGDLEENIPNSWLLNNDGRTENIEVSFQDLGDQIFGFKTPMEVSDQIVIIDPVPTRIWGSYAGGYGEDYGRIKTDSQNKGYLYGSTTSVTNFASSGTYQQNLAGNSDAFLMKISKDGQKIWGTYFGTPQNDAFGDIDFDENFNIYAGGEIYRVGSNIDVVLAKFNTNGGLIFRRDYIGNSPDYLYTVSYNQNKIYIGGQTFSPNFPTNNAVQQNKLSPNGSTDGFLASVDASGTTLWSTYFGATDYSTSIFNIFSSTGDLEIIGATRSQLIPMINPFQATNSGVTDGLYLKFSNSGVLLRSSYFGNSIQDVVREARIVNGNLILAGEFPDLNAPTYTVPGIWRINLNNNIITKVGLPFQYQVQLTAYIDSAGNVFFSGLTHHINQTDIATPGAYMEQTGPTLKTFMIKYNANNIKQWGTFYGGNGGTQLGEVTKDDEDFIYLTGMSSNNTTGIATPGTFQQTGGHPSNDIFIAKFKDCTSSAIITSNSPVCVNSLIQLHASGGTTYNWTGPNGFTSISQNPTIPNATIANSGIYTCEITGSGACDGSFTVNVMVGDTVSPIPNVANLPDITGDCQTAITLFPTASDNCSGTITATTSDPLSYSSAGSYVIHWSYDDGNGNTVTQNQNVIITAVPPPVTQNAIQTFCAANFPKISDIQITGQNIKWYDAGGNLLNSTTLLVNGQTYYATQTINNCESIKIPLLIQITTTAPPVAVATQDFCISSNPTLADITVTGNSLQYYDLAGNVLPLTTPLVNSETYYISQSVAGCVSAKTPVLVSLSLNNIPAANYTHHLCNNSFASDATINLHQFEQNLITNSNNYIFEYSDGAGNIINNPAAYLITSGQNTIKVKVSNNEGCYKIVDLIIILYLKPFIEIPATVRFCKGQNLTLNAGSGYFKYLWSTGETTPSISISLPGIYTVEVTTAEGCKSTASITASYYDFGEISAVTINNSSATVTITPAGNYEYSLDNSIWQNSNVFENLLNQEYTVYVRTPNGCFVDQQNFTIFSILNTITPNADGYNDNWYIKGIENYPGSKITVVNRQGQTVFSKTIQTEKFIWDGKMNENPLPTGSYWYVIEISDKRIFTGWLLIKNVN